MNLDKNIKRVMLIDKGGNIIDDKIRKGDAPFLTAEELRNFTFGTAIKAGMSERWNKRLGPLNYIVSVRPKLIIFRFFRREGTVIVTAEPNISLAIADRMASLLSA